jgi:HTH-type transcriptional regulator, sugar sensing transcriptional regulator
MTSSRKDAGSRPRTNDEVIRALSELGFSQYEARTYAGMIGREPMTGYAVAKETKVPQPKVYETLGRLVDRGVVVQVSGAPAKFIALPPARVLAQLEAAFRQRLSTAELEIARMGQAETDTPAMRPYNEATSWISIAAAAKDLLRQAETRIYISGHSQHLTALRDEIRAADTQGIRIDLLCFGEPRLALASGSVVRHSSTDGKLYRHHQARHLGIAVDSRAALWALAPDGRDWQAVWADDDPLLTALVKGFVRHDLFIQRVYHDMTEEMIGRYGPGLAGLFDWHPAESAAGIARATG